MWHVWRTGDVKTGFWLVYVTQRDHLEDLGIDDKIILRWTFTKSDGEAWIGFIVAQDRDRWQALADVAINFRVS